MRRTLVTLLAFAGVVAGFGGLADALMPADPAPAVEVVFDTTERAPELSPQAQVAAYRAAQVAR